MARMDYDGVVEAARWDDRNHLKWVRAYLRRGPVWSDLTMLDREALVEQINAGKRFVVGRRIPQLAGSFEVYKPVNLVEKNGHQILVTGDLQVERDTLEGVPLL
jgi:hypothetical protein